MFTTFVIAVTALFSGLLGGFEQGQANPNAESFIESTSNVFVDDREYGVDSVE